MIVNFSQIKKSKQVRKKKIGKDSKRGRSEVKIVSAIVEKLTRVADDEERKKERERGKKSVRI